MLKAQIKQYRSHDCCEVFKEIFVQTEPFQKSNILLINWEISITTRNDELKELHIPHDNFFVTVLPLETKELKELIDCFALKNKISKRMIKHLKDTCQKLTTDLNFKCILLEIIGDDFQRIAMIQNPSKKEFVRVCKEMFGIES